MHRVFMTPVSDVYSHYVNKVERHGRTAVEVDAAISWLTGFTRASIHKYIKQNTTFENFFAAATINPNAVLITGSICGVKIQDIEDPLMKNIRYLDKLVDEIAKGKPMDKVLR